MTTGTRSYTRIQHFRTNRTGGNLISVDDKEFVASTFLIHARELYADLILEYLDLVVSQDASIEDINEQIDDRTLEHGTEVREQLF